MIVCSIVKTRMKKDPNPTSGDESYNDFDSYTINLQSLESQRKETWEVEALVLIIVEANI